MCSVELEDSGRLLPEEMATHIHVEGGMMSGSHV